MKVAIIGSRTLKITDMEAFVPEETTEIVSGGALGVDTCARKFAEESGLLYTEFLPEYDRYGRAAPIRRNDQIIDYADLVIALWDGISRGTKYVIDRCQAVGKPLRAYRFNPQPPAEEPEEQTACLPEE